VNFRNWKALGRFGSRRQKESVRLDAFLKDLADPGLIDSLKQEDGRRASWTLAVAFLVLGLLLGAGAAAWWLSHHQPAPAPNASEDLAHALTLQGLALTNGKEILQAWSYIRLATEIRPNMVEAWAALGSAQLYGGQADDAERSFRRCVQLDPADPRGLQGLGEVYFALGDYKTAEDLWLKVNAKRSLSRLRLLQGRFNEAAPLIQELARQTPDQVYVQTMVEALRAGRLSPKLRWRLAPGLVVSRSPETARGWRLYFARQYGEAAGVFSRVLARAPGDQSARIGRGWCRLNLRSYQEAREDFERAHTAWPSDYSALNGLGWCMKALGRADEAAEAWGKLLELQPQSPETPECLKGLGMLAFDRGDYLGADHNLTESLLRNPFDQETRTLLNETLRRLPAGEG
jgi:Flp pilus assembly protein TadD